MHFLAPAESPSVPGCWRVCLTAAPGSPHSGSGPRPPHRHIGGGRSPHAHCACPSTQSSPLYLRQSPPTAGSRWRQRSVNFCSGGGGYLASMSPQPVPADREQNTWYGTTAPSALSGSIGSCPSWLETRFLTLVICPNQSGSGSSWKRLLLSLFRTFDVAQIRCPLSN